MNPLKRRSFIKSSLALGSFLILGSSFLGKLLNAGNPFNVADIYTAPGNDPRQSVRKLIDALGGIERFVKTGNSIGFLINSPWKVKGFYTDPDVAIALVEMCKEAGAGQLVCYKPVRDGYWESSRYYEEAKPIIDEIIYGDERTTVAINNGVELKEAEIFSIFQETDVFINIPVAKHHNGTLYSGTLKGLMGVSSGTTNRYMHSPDGEYTYSKQDYLAQCIADLNLIRQPDLCIVDAIECALENGPRGPGNTTKPNRILASTDVLAVDIYAATLMGFSQDDIPTFMYAGKHKLGKSNLNEITVKEV